MSWFPCCRSGSAVFQRLGFLRVGKVNFLPAVTDRTGVAPTHLGVDLPELRFVHRHFIGTMRAGDVEYAIGKLGGLILHGFKQMVPATGSDYFGNLAKEHALNQPKAATAPPDALWRQVS